MLSSLPPLPQAPKHSRGAVKIWLNLHHFVIRDFRRGGGRRGLRLAMWFILGFLLFLPLVGIVLSALSGVISHKFGLIEFSKEPIRFCIGIAVSLVIAVPLAYPFLAGITHLFRRITGRSSAFDKNYRESR